MVVQIFSKSKSSSRRRLTTASCYVDTSEHSTEGEGNQVPVVKDSEFQILQEVEEPDPEGVVSSISDIKSSISTSAEEDLNKENISPQSRKKCLANSSDCIKPSRNNSVTSSCSTLSNSSSNNNNNNNFISGPILSRSVSRATFSAASPTRKGKTSSNSSVSNSSSSNSSSASSIFSNFFSRLASPVSSSSSSFSSSTSSSSSSAVLSSVKREMASIEGACKYSEESILQVKELANFFRKRQQIELEYANSLAKLCIKTTANLNSTIAANAQKKKGINNWGVLSRNKASSSTNNLISASSANNLSSTSDITSLTDYNENNESSSPAPTNTSNANGGGGLVDTSVWQAFEEIKESIEKSSQSHRLFAESMGAAFLEPLQRSIKEMETSRKQLMEEGLKSAKELQESYTQLKKIKQASDEAHALAIEANIANQKAINQPFLSVSSGNAASVSGGSGPSSSIISAASSLKLSSSISNGNPLSSVASSMGSNTSNLLLLGSSSSAAKSNISAIEKTSSKFHSAQEKARDALDAYNACEAACKQMQEKHYRETIPKLLSRFKQREYDRFGQVHSILQLYCQLMKRDIDNLVRCVERMEERVDAVDIESDIKNFVEEYINASNGGNNQINSLQMGNVNNLNASSNNAATVGNMLSASGQANGSTNALNMIGNDNSLSVSVRELLNPLKAGRMFHLNNKGGSSTSAFSSSDFKSRYCILMPTGTLYIFEHEDSVKAKDIINFNSLQGNGSKLRFVHESMLPSSFVSINKAPYFAFQIIVSSFSNNGANNSSGANHGSILEFPASSTSTNDNRSSIQGNTDSSNTNNNGGSNSSGPITFHYFIIEGLKERAEWMNFLRNQCKCCSNCINYLSPNTNSISFDLPRLMKSVKVSVTEVNNLPIGNSTTDVLLRRATDAYVILWMDEHRVARTTSVSTKSSNNGAFWGEDFILDDIPACVGRLRLCVMGKRPLKRDYEIGYLDLNLDELGGGEKKEDWFKLVISGSDSSASGSSNSSAPSIRVSINVINHYILPYSEYGKLERILFKKAVEEEQSEDDTDGEDMDVLVRYLIQNQHNSNNATGVARSIFFNSNSNSNSNLPLLPFAQPNREEIARLLVHLYSNQNLELYFISRLIACEINSTDDLNILFRANSLASKALDYYMKIVGTRYLHSTLGDLIAALQSKSTGSRPESLEIDPTRLSSSGSGGGSSGSGAGSNGSGDNEGERNLKRLLGWVNSFWDAIALSLERCPLEMKCLFNVLSTETYAKFNSVQSDCKYLAVSGFLFLRFFCPAILNPKLFGMATEHPDPSSVWGRNLTLIAKVLQNLANLAEFSGQKEPHMVPLNTAFIKRNINLMKAVLDKMSTLPNSSGLVPTNLMLSSTKLVNGNTMSLIRGSRENINVVANVTGTGSASNSIFSVNSNANSQMVSIQLNSSAKGNIESMYQKDLATLVNCLVEYLPPLSDFESNKNNNNNGSAGVFLPELYRIVNVFKSVIPIFFQRYTVGSGGDRSLVNAAAAAANNRMVTFNVGSGSNRASLISLHNSASVNGSRMTFGQIEEEDQNSNNDQKSLEYDQREYKPDDEDDQDHTMIDDDVRKLEEISHSPSNNAVKIHEEDYDTSGLDAAMKQTEATVNEMLVMKKNGQNAASDDFSTSLFNALGINTATNASSESSNSATPTTTTNNNNNALPSNSGGGGTSSSSSVVQVRTSMNSPSSPLSSSATIRRSRNSNYANKELPPIPPLINRMSTSSTQPTSNLGGNNNFTLTSSSSVASTTTPLADINPTLRRSARDLARLFEDRSNSNHPQNSNRLSSVSTGNNEGFDPHNLDGAAIKIPEPLLASSSNANSTIHQESTN